MNKISFIDAAKYVGITLSQAKYWSKLLQLETVKESRNLFLVAGGEKILETMNKIVSGGVSPSAAAKEILSVHALPVVQEHTEENINDKLTERIISLEKAVMMLVDHNKMLKAENEAQNKFIISSLRNIQLRLDPPIKNKEIKVWQPPKSNRPQVSMLKRLWYEIVNPVKLRAN